MYYDNMVIYIGGSISLGVVASLIAWWIVNIILIPKFGISELLYDSKYRPYIKIWNKSWHGLNAYEIACSSYYYEGEKKEPVFIRIDNSKPVLTKGTRDNNSFIIKLEIDGKLQNFFQNGNKLKIIVTGQNRFGVKQICTKEINIGDSATTDPIYIEYV